MQRIIRFKGLGLGYQHITYLHTPNCSCSAERARAATTGSSARGPAQSPVECTALKTRTCCHTAKSKRATSQPAPACKARGVGFQV